MWKNIIIKFIQIFIVVFSITEVLLAQDILWQRNFDTGAPDYAEDITSDSQGNIIVVGKIQVQSVQPPNSYDFLIIKYTPTGDTLWIRSFNSEEYDVASGVAVDIDDNIIITGSSYSGTTYTSMKVMKYSAFGEILWSLTFSLPDTPISGWKVATNSYGDIIITGNIHSNWGDYITLKYDSNGNFLWKREYDGGWEDVAQDVSVDNSDNIIITGYSNSNTNWDWCTIKYNSNGDSLWTSRYDVALDDKAFGVICDKDENIIVVGKLGQSPEIFGSIVKYTSEGSIIWVKIFTDTLQYAKISNIVDVESDNQGNIYLVGEYAYWNDIGQIWTDYYIAMCEFYGDIVWAKRYSYGGRNEPRGITVDQGGNIIATGSSYPNPEETNQRDCFTIKLQNRANSIEESSSVHNSFALCQNYPNPFNISTILRYEIPEAALVKITLYDLQGSNLDVLVSEYKRPGKYIMAWDATNFSSGVYFIQMTAGNHITSHKILLIK